MRNFLSRLNRFGAAFLMMNLLLLSLTPAFSQSQGQKSNPTPVVKNTLPNDQKARLPINTNSPPASRKLALLVGISKYNRTGKEGEWWNLNTKADIELLASVLVQKFEFNPDDIKILSDEEIVFNGKTISPVKPTRQLIADTFRSFLTGQAVKGRSDIIYFHFSGHGQTITDTSGDENDKMDETLVPADYVSRTDGSKNILDDEISIWLNELSQKNPATVTVTLDSCFSGTATRGHYDLPTRGQSSKNNETTGVKPDESAADFLARGTNRGGDEPQYVFLAAASPYQTAKETYENKQAVGLFTWSLVTAMNEADEKTTYRDLFEKISDVITRKQRDQNPQIEGTQIDKLVMKDGAEPPNTYLGISVVEKSVKLQAGRLQGITAGSIFRVCGQGAKKCEDREKLFEAKVAKVRLTSSELEIIGDVPPDKIAKSARAFEASRNYENILKVAVQGIEKSPAIDEIFKSLGLAEKVDPNDSAWNVLIRPVSEQDKKTQNLAATFDGVVLQRPDQSIIKAISKGDKMTGELRKALHGEARWHIVKTLENSDTSLKIEINAIPVDVDWEKGPNGETLLNEVKGDKQGGLTRNRGQIELKENDWVRLEIKNVGDADAYVTVLNLEANGVISAAHPNKIAGIVPDNIIKKGETFKVPNYFRIKPPFGQESFRAIATRTPTDFSPLVDEKLLTDAQGRGVSLESVVSEEVKTQRSGDSRVSNALQSPLGKILLAAQEGKRSDTALPPSWATATITFFVVPATKN